MKSIRVGQLLIAALLLAAGCSYLPFARAHKRPPTAAPAPTPSPSMTATPTSTATPEARKRRHHKHAARTPTPTPATSPTPVAGESAAGTVITTGESAAERAEVDSSLNRLNKQLAHIRRDRLNPQDAADYDRISSFIGEARSALREHDFLRARSLTEKAARLAAQLSSRVSNP